MGELLDLRSGIHGEELKGGRREFRRESMPKTLLNALMQKKNLCLETRSGRLYLSLRFQRVQFSFLLNLM